MTHRRKTYQIFERPDFKSFNSNIPLQIAALTVSLGCLGVAEAAVFRVNSTTDAVDMTPGDRQCASISGACTLRAAIQESNALPGRDIVLVPRGFYQVSIPSLFPPPVGLNDDAVGDLDITDSLLLTGAGPGVTIIDGNAIHNVLEVSGPNTVSIVGLTIQNGSGSAVGGGIIHRDSDLSLVQVLVTNNIARSAAGIHTDSGRLRLTDTTVSFNKADGADGGGIGSSHGSIELNGVTLSGNTANGHGGGIALGSGELTLTNTTISGNQAFLGGGVYTFSAASTDLTNVTIANNSVVNGGSGGGFAGEVPASVRFKGSIVANNSSGSDCAFPSGSGSVGSLGHNLDSDATCGFTLVDDLPGRDPLLGPLQNNGGPTQTQALSINSPALDAAGTDCPPPRRDQRGVRRPQGPACDIGAFERIQRRKHSASSDDNELQ